MLTAPFPHPWKDNPEGCQRVAGGRSGKRGNDHRNSASEGPSPWRGARRSYQTTPRPRIPGHLISWRVTGSGAMPISSPHGSNESGTQPEVATPKNPRRPPATLWQPSRLTAPYCPNSSLLQRKRGIRHSDFGLLSAFGLRPSDLGSDEEPKDHSINAPYDLPALLY